MRRVRTPPLRAAVLLAVVLAAAVLAGGTSAGTSVQLQPPRARTLTLAPSTHDFTTLTDDARARLVATEYWGGTFTAATGETVTLFLSDSYVQDQATAQRWVDFLARLVHGSELSQLEAYLLPLREVQSFCGVRALACYSPRRSTLVAPGESPSASLTAEGIVAHEYGHHVAANRDNAPWEAVDYGTKRWASYMNICGRADGGEVYPGDEGENYELNPGEGFAEAYRVLNERRLGIPESPWEIVTSTFAPDATALTLIEQDVTQPWAQAAASSYRGTSGRAYSFATALDGSARVTLRGSARTRFRLEISQNGKRVLRTTTTVGSGRTAGVSICGERTLQIRVKRVAGKGGYSLTVAKP